MCPTLAATKEVVISTYSPTVRRRRLSHILRQLRKDAGLTATQAAKQMGWDPSKLVRIERNEWKLPSLRDMADVLDFYGVTDPTRREAILTLARQSRQRGWWEEYRKELGGAFPEFEAEADQISSFEVLVVPGLLQTSAYAAAIFRGVLVPEEEIGRRVEARLTRQRILDRADPPTLRLLLDESALHKQVGGQDVMREQVEHIIAMTARSNITLQIVPNTVGAHASMGGSFSILEYADGEDLTLVHIDSAAGDLFVEGTEEVNRYTHLFDHMQASALSVDTSLEFMSNLVQLAK